MVSELLSIVIVPLFLDVEGCENNLAIRGVGDVRKAGACSGGKAEIVGNGYGISFPDA